MLGTQTFPISFPSFRIKRPVAIGIALLLIAAIVAASVVLVRSRTATDYVTQPVARQDLVQTVTASGTVNPRNTVTVGTQVSGTINAIYVDYNSKVRKGQVLAKLDQSQLLAQLNQARSALAQSQAQAAAAGANAAGATASIDIANANAQASRSTSAAQQANAQAAQAAIATATANVTKAQSALQLAQQTASRDRALLGQGYVPQSQADSDTANVIAAQTALSSAEAAVQQARAQAVAGMDQAAASAAQSNAQAAQASQSVSQAAGSADSAQAAAAAVGAAQAQVQQDELNLQRTVITSPVDGTVIARAVSVGQTVAASLQTPTLFTIAQDLKKMEVDISVGEPDIGSVAPGENIDFSVLAYPNETFHGKVAEVRQNPTTVNNVVTYTVISEVDNPQDKLLPGMTANVTIDVKTAHNALVVPSQALTYRPAFSGTRHRTAGASAANGTNSAANKQSSTAQGAASPWGQTAAGASNAPVAGNNGSVFVQRNGKVQRVRVRIDLISGTQAAVTPVDANATLTAGELVIVSDNAQHPQRSGGGSQNRSQNGPGMSQMGGIGRAIR